LQTFGQIGKTTFYPQGLLARGQFGGGDTALKGPDGAGEVEDKDIRTAIIAALGQPLNENRSVPQNPATLDGSCCPPPHLPLPLPRLQ